MRRVGGRGDATRDSDVDVAVLAGEPIADVLAATGDADTERFLDFVLSDYARLNEERRDILGDVRERGSVLGG